MTARLFHRLLAEAVGTAMLVLVGAGSVVATLTVDGEIGYAGLGFIALAFAFVVALVIYGFGPVSGAHSTPRSRSRWPRPGDSRGRRSCPTSWRSWSAASWAQG